MIGRLILQGLGFAYGLFNLIPYTIFAAIDGQLFKRTTKEEEKELAIAQAEYWDLGGHPFGCTHAFYALPDGQKLHYVFRTPQNKSPNLIVFLHGFPDSYVLWARYLESPQFANSANLVALDLPGYGGSDELPRHSGGRVLEAISKFILAMREEYHGGDGKVIVVGHDWGAIMTARLAIDAPQLADRFIIASSTNPNLMASNVKNWTSSARLMLHTFLMSPLPPRPALPRLALLRTAATTLSPIFDQLRRSNYIFSFNLPAPLAGYVGSLGNRWLLRVMHGATLGPSRQRRLLSGTAAATAMACSAGPSARECDDTAAADGTGYPISVRRRIPDAGWMSKLRLYRENAMFGRWEKSLETLAALSDLPGPAAETSSPALEASRRTSAFGTAPAGACRAPVTAFFGTADIALEPRLCTNGLQDYLAPRSQVVLLDRGGHWVPLEKGPGELLGAAVLWALREGGEGGRPPLREALRRVRGEAADGFEEGGEREVEVGGKKGRGKGWRIAVDQ